MGRLGGTEQIQRWAHIQAESERVREQEGERESGVRESTYRAYDHVSALFRRYFLLKCEPSPERGNDRTELHQQKIRGTSFIRDSFGFCISFLSSNSHIYEFCMQSDLFNVFNGLLRITTIPYVCILHRIHENLISKFKKWFFIESKTVIPRKLGMRNGKFIYISPLSALFWRCDHVRALGPGCWRMCKKPWDCVCGQPFGKTINLSPICRRARSFASALLWHEQILLPKTREGKEEREKQHQIFRFVCECLANVLSWSFHKRKHVA